MMFNGKRIRVGHFRKGICVKCEQKKLTGIYHIEKYIEHPRMNMIELCRGCAIVEGLAMKK